MEKKYLAVTYEDIDNACDKSSLINNPSFLRHDATSQFVHKDRIKATLKKKRKILPRDANIDELVEYVRDKAQKIFLTLVLSNTLKNICILSHYEFTDEDLPVTQDSERCIRSRGVKVKAFEDWKSFDKDSFIERQWVFLAPILEEKKSGHYRYSQSQSLESLRELLVLLPKPRYPQSTKMADAGGPCLVAVKRLATDSADEEMLDKLYQREVKTLETMRDLDSPHLIRAYAAFKKKKRGGQYDRAFVFPWASGGNLSSLWAKEHQATNRKIVYRWALSQILGLAHGIKQLHDTKTRHGDIKPENILVFPDDQGGYGTLVIADVGLAKYHAFYTRQRSGPTTTIHGSPMYEPPETHEVKHKLSRKYDVWSFGCVLFQFLIWLIKGPGGIKGFLNEFKTDRASFWEAKSKSVTVRPAIEIWAKYLPQSIQGEKVPSEFRIALAKLLRLVRKRLLIVNVDSIQGSQKPRANSCEMLQKIQKICDRGLAHLPPLDPQSQSNSLPRDKGSDIAAQDITVPLSKNQTDYSREHASLEIHGKMLQTMKSHVASSLVFFELFQNCWKHTPRQYATGVLSRAGVVYKKDLQLFRTKSILSASPGGPPLLSIYSDTGSTVDTSSYAQIGLPWLPKAASSQEFHILREWIRLCDETHACFRAQDDGTRVSRLPTRVLDVGQADDPLLRLAQPSTGIRDKYVALSHCWGKINRDSDSRLENGNIKEFMKAISFNKLPKMFRDAIEVTRALSIRYLWIDSLCIIQDSDHDWEVESRKMEDVYSLAYVTIAASSAESSLKGFIHDRPTRACAKVATTDALLYIAEAIDDFQTDVEDGVLNTRAWVLQERALSRRTIHFTSAQIYWECGKGVHCETLAQLRNPVSQFLGDHDFPNLGLQYFKDERIELIQYLYMRYSELKLSNATDRPAAISGLQKRLGCTFKSEADCGIIWKYFERTIFWKARIEHGLSRIQYKSSQVSPPSWSWMAYSGAISYLEIPFGKVDWTGDLWNPPSTQKPGPYYEMALLASARKIVIRRSKLFASVTLDMDIRADFGGGQWRCVTVGKDKTTDALGDTVYYVLLIRPMLAGKSRDIYERVGVGTLHGGGFSTEVEQVWLL
ncbi:hypothetical protein NUW58_g2897 [Xylaria curta]|uniref:Uncharacterized protein n=1 Tax=Xylaria curta TaxID=42375 RepID=A0ACC1PDZ2_9PEZI|nr:hypothetical protein NUW58_g2897 [Xylaria curta]